MRRAGDVENPPKRGTSVLLRPRRHISIGFGSICPIRRPSQPGGKTTVDIRVGLKDVPECRAWLERVEPTTQAVNVVKVVRDSPVGEIQEAFSGLTRQIRYRVFCQKGWGHGGKHKFQVGYDIIEGRKKLETKNGNRA